MSHVEPTRNTRGQNSPVLGGPGLPPPSKAFAFICECFGLNRTPNGKSKDPTGKLRQELYRFFSQGDAKQSEEVRRRMEERFFSHLRRHDPSDFGHAYAAMDEAALILLSIYTDLSDRLNRKGRSVARVLWLLAEQVLVPTLLGVWARRWPTGLEHEFAGDRSWYLPITKDGEIQLPFARVFDYWMRVARIKSTNQLASMLLDSGCCSKTDRTDTLRKKLGRWKEGKGPIALKDLFKYVDALESEVDWLASPGDWKARFALASAMQAFLEKADEFFKDFDPKPSLSLAAWFRISARKGILVDEERFLAQPRTCFAVGLIQERLKKTREWSKLSKLPKHCGRLEFGPEISDEEIQRRSANAERDSKLGNRFADWFRRNAESAGRAASSQDRFSYYLSIQDYIFDLGVQELQKLIDSLP